LKINLKNKKNYISVLITNYNKSFFLKKSLDKTINQSFKNFEVIIFDDKSTDNSVDILKKYRNIRVIRNRKKKFNTPALNQLNGIIKCLKSSKGNILCLMDADDFFKKNKLKEVNNFFQNNKKLNCFFNFPKIRNKNFTLKKRKIFATWPRIFPTSCISVRKNFFLKFIKHCKPDNFNFLEIDTRFLLYSFFFCNEYSYTKKKLTVYNYDPNGITSNIRFFSKLWWIRRSQAFEYLRYIKKKKNQKFVFNLDYILTTLINKIF
jgi:glycosyltransferase involved in cell wall biosynthesis